MIVNPSIISTGNVAIGSSKAQVVTLTNTTNAPLTIKQAALIGKGFKAPGLAPPFSLAPGRSFSFALQFAPTSVGSIAGSLSLVSDAPRPLVKVSLLGSGVANSPLSTPASIMVNVVPSLVNLRVGASLQFAATVSGSSNSLVIWAVNGISGGSPVVGSISSTGTYTAPASLPSPATVTVTATSAASSAAVASSSVTLVNPSPPPASAPVSVAVSPSSVSIRSGASFQFSVTVSGGSNTAVTWAVNGISGGSPAVGSISSTGTYVAPAGLPNPPTVKVTATSAASSSATASSIVSLTGPVTPPTSTSNSAGPVLNVLNSGATVNTNVDATAAINSTVVALPPSGGTVYLPSGAYAIKNNGTVVTINRPHVIFECAPGAILQAQAGFMAGFPAGFPILDIEDAATDVLVQGCVFDGNGISGQGFQIQRGAAGIVVDQVESKNQTQNGGRGAIRTGGLVQITNSYFHNDPVGFYDYAGVGGTPSLHFDSNRCEVMTGNPVAHCAGASGLNSFEASNNSMTNISSGIQAALYCYGCDQVDWEHNTFNSVNAAIHCDTCGGGTVSFNTATNDTAVGFPDYFLEVGSNFTVEGNVSINKTGERGMVLGVGSNNQGPASLRTQVASFDTTNGFVPGSNVELSTDSADKQEGSGSLVASANGTFTTGTLWYSNFGTPQTFWLPYQDLWIKPTSGALAPGQLQLCMSVHSAISTCDLPVNLPAVAQGAWYRIITYATGWEGASSINGQTNPGFNSFGIRVTSNSPGLEVKFDDFDKATELLGYVALSNQIVSPAGACISFGALQGGTFTGNDCDSPGGSNPAYDDENSAGLTFVNNKSNFSSTVGTVHLLVDAPASPANVTASSDQTNASLVYACTNGGVVFH